MCCRTYEYGVCAGCAISVISSLQKKSHTSNNCSQTNIVIHIFYRQSYDSGIFLAYITSLLFGVLQYTNGICVMHRLGPPLATSLIYVSLAVKTIRLWRIFRASLKSVKRPRFISPRSQVVLTLVITVIPVCINIKGWDISSRFKASVCSR